MRAAENKEKAIEFHAKNSQVLRAALDRRRDDKVSQRGVSPNERP
jgi:hypothetical protein